MGNGNRRLKYAVQLANSPPRYPEGCRKLAVRWELAGITVLGVTHKVPPQCIAVRPCFGVDAEALNLLVGERHQPIKALMVALRRQQPIGEHSTRLGAVLERQRAIELEHASPPAAHLGFERLDHMPESKNNMASFLQLHQPETELVHKTVDTHTSRGDNIGQQRIDPPQYLGSQLMLRRPPAIAFRIGSYHRITGETTRTSNQEKLFFGDGTLESCSQNPEYFKTDRIVCFLLFVYKISYADMHQPFDRPFHKSMADDRPQPVNKNKGVALRCQLLQGSWLGPAGPFQYTEVAGRTCPQPSQPQLRYQQGLEPTPDTIEELPIRISPRQAQGPDIPGEQIMRAGFSDPSDLGPPCSRGRDSSIGDGGEELCSAR